MSDKAMRFGGAGMLHTYICLVLEASAEHPSAAMLNILQLPCCCTAAALHCHGYCTALACCLHISFVECLFSLISCARNRSTSSSLSSVQHLHLFPQCSSDRTGQSAPPLYSLGLAAFPQQDNIVSLLLTMHRFISTSV